MHRLSIPYTDDLLVMSGKAPKELEEELSFLLAAKLFELHRLSLGKAAEAHLIVFNRDPEISWDDKIWQRLGRWKSREMSVWGM